MRSNVLSADLKYVIFCCIFSPVVCEDPAGEIVVRVELDDVAKNDGLSGIFM